MSPWRNTQSQRHAKNQYHWLEYESTPHDESKHQIFFVISKCVTVTDFISNYIITGDPLHDLTELHTT